MLLDIFLVGLEFRSVAVSSGACTLCAMHVLVHFVHSGAGLMATLAEGLRAIGIRELDKMMVKDITIVPWVDAPAHCVGLHGNATFRIAVFGHHLAISILCTCCYDVVAVEPTEASPNCGSGIPSPWDHPAASQITRDPPPEPLPALAGTRSRTERTVVDLLDALAVRPW